MPDRLCEHEVERHEWRGEVLAFIRDHLEPLEVYRLGPADLEFGELLPEKPWWLEQAEYEERVAVGFNLERLVNEVRRSRSCSYDGAAAVAARGGTGDGGEEP